jgi:hypothetical protein
MATMAGLGASARTCSGRIASRSTSGSQSGTGSRLATPSSPLPTAGATATIRLVNGCSSFPITSPGRSGASAARTAPILYPSARAARSAARGMAVSPRS